MNLGINYRQQYAKYARYFKQLVQIYRKKPEVRASVQFLLTLLTVSFFAVFAIRPTVNTISSLIAEIKVQEETGQKLKQKLQDLEKAQIAWEAQKNKIIFVDQALPQQPETVAFIRQLEALTASRGVRLKNLSHKEVVLLGKEMVKQPEQNEQKKDMASPPKGTVPVDINFSAEGVYGGLLSFLQDLENLRRILIPDTLSFRTSGGAEGEEAPGLLLSISGQISYYESE